MDINDKYIIALVKASIFDQIPEMPPNDLDWDYIFRKVNEQSVTGLICCALGRLPGDSLPGVELMSRWNKLMLATMGIMANRHNEFLRMSRLMAERSITAIGLKGCIVRNLYPIPELRTMGDFDVLIPKKDLPEVVQLFLDEGYSVKDAKYGVVCLKETMLWEIFSTLAEEFPLTTEKMDELYLNRYVVESGVKHPEATYFLAHMFVHTGKHYVETGAGIRNFCDIALYIKNFKAEIDFEMVRQICVDEGYEKIYRYLVSLVNDWFDVSLPDLATGQLDTEKFLEYSLLHGIFGKHDNWMAVEAVHTAGGKHNGLRAVQRILFPNVKQLNSSFKYLQRKPFLLPAAWIHRGIRAVFVKKYSIKQLAEGLNDAVDFSDERTAWLKELGLP